MRNDGINILGIISLATLLTGALTASFIVGIFLSLFGLILTTVLYAKLDKLGYGTNLCNMNIYQWLIAFVPSAIMVYYAVNQYTKSSHGVSFVILICSLALLLFMAIVNYYIGKSLLLIAKKVDNQWFKVSAILTKIAAFSMLFAGLGFFFLVLAQPFFLIGCITYKPMQSG